MSDLVLDTIPDPDLGDGLVTGRTISETKSGLIVVGDKLIVATVADLDALEVQP